MKDLRKSNLDLKKTIAINDNPKVYRLQPDNLIVPRKDFLGEADDQVLLELLPFLYSLSFVEDVRPYIKEWKSRNKI